ncbi:MAG: pyrroline-5-carboxylate reductase [Candidatus Omnitrophota bacterium]
MKNLGDKKLGVIGVGNMGASIVEGVLARRITTPSRVWIYDKATDKARSFARRHRVGCVSSAAELLKKTDVVLLAMKPQDFVDFALEHRSSFRPGQGVISILAGMTTERIAKALGKNVTIVRAMPNLGAKVGRSMTVICGKNKKALSFAATLFAGCGEVATLPEKKLDLVTAISGSGPAYFFHLMELLEDFGVKQGLRPEVARVLAVQTGLGATLLAKSSQESCSELRQRVTSKKGTTEAALKTLQRGKFGQIFQRALRAAMDRSLALRRVS